MRLYVVRGDLAFSALRPVPEAPWPTRGGQKVQAGWRLVDLEPYDQSREEFLPVDCFALNASADGLILSETARESLEPLLAQSGEFWPVRVFGRPYWWFNCLVVADVLDRQRTIAEWSTVKGAWGSFQWITSTRRLAFREQTLDIAPVSFRVPEYPQGVLFGRDVLRETVQTEGLTGFRFDVVWSTEGGGIDDPAGLRLGGLMSGDTAGEQSRTRASARRELARRSGKPV